MEHQYEEGAASPIKKQVGQSGIDGNMQRRGHCVEIRFSNDERDQLARHAITAGYSSLAQYLRESIRGGQTVPANTVEHVWLQYINRIGNYVAEIAVCRR